MLRDQTEMGRRIHKALCVECTKLAIATKGPGSSWQEGFAMKCCLIGRGWDGQSEDFKEYLLSSSERAPG